MTERYRQEVLRLLRERPDLSYHDIAQAVSPAITAEAVRHLARRNHLTRAALAGAPPVPNAPLVLHDSSADATVLTPEAAIDEDDDAFLARVLARTGRSVGVARTQRYATVVIPTREPIGISLASDFHLDARNATDVAGVLEHADIVRETPGLYTVNVGDLINNPIKHKPTAALDVPDELRLARIVLDRYGRKLLALIMGNHDAWTKAVAGVDPVRELARKQRVHVVPDELLLTVELADPDSGRVTASYLFVLRHRFRRHSNLNWTHACWRWQEENLTNLPVDDAGRVTLPDVIALAHHHVAAVETRSFQHRDQIAVRMGSFSIETPFSRGLGFAQLRPTAPVVILDPYRANEPVAVADYREGARLLTLLRENHEDATA